ncbi:hypothetical protein ABW21_db0204424 [Orbilia brochopaga]|nr:hypothetical protein ABW21_db0204424 [Drechslerella brochopaga]
MADTMDVDELGEPVPSFGTRFTVAPKDLHRDLQRSVTFSLEEGMNTKAIDLLCHLAYAGISTPAKPGAKKEIIIPSPEVLSILTTISLHPAFTTRRVGTLQADAALKASRYIRTIIRLAGASNCNLQQAWRFKRSIDGPAASDDEANTTRRMRNRNVVKAPPVGRRKRVGAAEIDTAPFAHLSIAHEESLFRLGDDIWAIIGWAMVCSCRYPKRWNLWRDFLELLVETLLADFQERIDAAETPMDMDLEGSLANSIGFLPNMVGGAGYKRIVRAIFANQSEKCRNEWTPVFPKETKKPPRSNGMKDWKAALENGLSSNKSAPTDIYSVMGKEAEEKMKEIRLNIDETSEAYLDFKAELARKGGFGDNLDADHEESEDDYNTGDTQPDDKAHPETDEHAIEAWGGIDSIVMRLKLMSLVSVYSVARDLVEEKKEQQLAEEQQLARSRKKKKPPQPQPPVSATTGPTEDMLETLQQALATPSVPVDEDIPSFLRKGDTGDVGDDAASSSSGSLSPASTGYITAYESSLNTPAAPTRIIDAINRSAASSPLSAPPSNLSPSPQFPSSPYVTALDIIMTSPVAVRGEAHMPVDTDIHLSSAPSDTLPPPPPPTDIPHLQPQAPHPNCKQISYFFAHDSKTLECFYDEYVDYLRAMPVKQMLLFTSPTVFPDAEIAFRASLLTLSLQSSMVWQPRYGWQTDLVTEQSLRECYLPHYARGNDVEAQVRMATLVEFLARLWHVKVGLRWDEELQDAVDAGIAARREKAEAAMSKKKKAPTAADKEMLSMLSMAEMRLRFLIQSARNATVKTKSAS